MDISVLYEDQDVVAINKPAGVMTHPDGHSTDETVSDWFAAQCPASKEVGETQRLVNGTEILRPGIVHRLDRDTSGVLVLAKTPEAHTFLKQAFQAHTVQKTYLALVYGIPKERAGAINFAIGRSRKDFRLRSAQPKAKGQMREALTHYRTLSDIGTHSLLEVQPLTGRTHQIRVHLKAIHHPIVCDPLYAPNHPCDLGLSRMGLHAYSLSLTLPSGKETIIKAPVPEDIKKAIKMFSNTEEYV